MYMNVGGSGHDAQWFDQRDMAPSHSVRPGMAAHPSGSVLVLVLVLSFVPAAPIYIRECICTGTEVSSPQGERTAIVRRSARGGGAATPSSRGNVSYAEVESSDDDEEESSNGDASADGMDVDDDDTRGGRDHASAQGYDAGRGHPGRRVRQGEGSESQSVSSEVREERKIL